MRRLGRRSFLRGAGAALLASPFAGLLGAGRTRAAVDGRASRLILFFSPNGTIHAHRRPTGAGAAYDFPAGSILEPLRNWRDQMLVLDGLDFHGADNHEGGMRAMLTGGGETSIDQHIAAELPDAAMTRFRSLELGVQTSAWGGSTQTRMSYDASGRLVPPDDEPRSVFRRLFGEAGASDAEVDETVRRQRSVLDNVRAELGGLRDRIGAEEAIKVDAHLTSLREVERGLAGPMLGGECGAPLLSDFDAQAPDAFPMVTRSMIDLAVAAASCDASRVLSIQCAHTVAPHVFGWLGHSEGHHALSHMADANPGGVAQFVEAERWFAEQFAYLLQRLSELPEPGGDGSMLDYTAVAWVKELGDSRLHVCTDVPFVLAGGANGCWSPGRYLTFDGDPHNQLLVSLAQTMGLPTRTFGDASFGTGPLEGLS